MKNILTTITIISAIILTGCVSSPKIYPEKITRTPEKNILSTTGIGESIYTYDKQGKEYFSMVTYTAVNVTNSIKQEIVYSGFSRGVLKITYREYLNDYARASFFQDAEYDYTPKTKTIISFKGAKIEILDANNNEIKYKVLMGFKNEQKKPLQ